MEIKRLYDYEVRFLKIIIFLLIVLLGIASYFIFRNNTPNFESYLVKGDYARLYNSIQSPDFSKDIFVVYMNYNYGEHIKINEVVSSKDRILYKVKSNNGEKEIKIVNRDGKFYWVFEDYIYDWTIILNKDARLTLENIAYKNIDGKVTIKKIPFAVYEIFAVMENCSPYKAKLLAGQDIEIKLKIADNIVDLCTGKVQEYLSFRENAVNNGKLREISCVDKESGVYREILDEMEIAKNLDYKITKKIKGIKVSEGIVDSFGMICLSVKEQWNISILNNGRTENKVEELSHQYFIDQNSGFKIVGIKTIQ